MSILNYNLKMNDMKTKLVDFDIEKAKENIKNLNPNATILCVSAKSGEGMDEFVDWLKETINN